MVRLPDTEYLYLLMPGFAYKSWNSIFCASPCLYYRWEWGHLFVGYISWAQAEKTSEEYRRKVNHSYRDSYKLITWASFDHTIKWLTRGDNCSSSLPVKTLCMCIPHTDHFVYLGRKKSKAGWFSPMPALYQWLLLDQIC